MVDVAHIIPPSPDDPPRRPSRVRPWHAAVALVVAAAVGGGLYVWKPWQSVDVPASACWGLLTGDQIRPLVGADGQAHEISSGGDLSGGSQTVRCGVAWRPASGEFAVEIEVTQVLESTYQSEVRSMTSAVAANNGTTTLDLGTGTSGWIYRGAAPRVLFRCDSHRQSPADNVYREIVVSGATTLSGRPTREVVQDYADLALRTAREVVRQEGCPDVHLVERAPVVPAK
ncbi:hypothetical protein BX285_4023 [Streptomyces sp. 1114.5]|uniref:hypothetical protein n=1 Tax=unclassified Streptomyces TaxID=2593676 RepID=UPI000BC5B316|nr:MULTISPECIES: hypothetical protein [unclassified Streptomyces]RKT19556.1 hypothetical protein BX285_4023 [Streptomyces sp. 1114.5]SOB85751.1 hypothetical protein SAMN06272789_6052 [Streptomyces sp. 1331.2]